MPHSDYRTGRSPSAEQQPEALVAYEVWDAPTRALHWVNALLLVVVTVVGFLFMFRVALHLDGKGSKLTLKLLHSLLGSALLFSWSARLLWGFRGNRFVRYSGLIPRKATFVAAFRELRAMRSPGGGTPYLGHGPLGRLSSTAMFVLLMTLLGTGLFRANTDLFFPPFGRTVVAAYLAKPGVDAASLQPGDKVNIDQTRQQRVYGVISPVGLLHEWAAWAMTLLVILHVVGVVWKELRQGGGVLSSMIVGRKVFPADQTPLADDD